MFPLILIRELLLNVGQCYSMPYKIHQSHSASFWNGVFKTIIFEAARANVYIIFSFIPGLVVNLLWQPEVIWKCLKLPDHAGSQTYATFLCKCVYLPLSYLSYSALYSSPSPILIVFKGDSDRCAALADCDKVGNSGLWWCVMNSTVDCVGMPFCACWMYVYSTGRNLSDVNFFNRLWGTHEACYSGECVMLFCACMFWVLCLRVCARECVIVCVSGECL